ncbi:MAG: type II toxin-antitoxin system VapC family toxin [Rudaea sp.]
MLVVDTNVLVYAANAASPFHAKCSEWLHRQRNGAVSWFVTWPILYEFLRATTHPKVFDRPWSVGAAWGFVESLLASPGLGILEHTERHAAVAAATISEFPRLAGNIVHDLHTAILMREHGISRICTCDADFHRFAFLQVLDPLVAA